MEGVETAFSAAQALLERTSVQDLCKAGQKIVLLEHNQTIGDALKSLSKSQILSAPMVRGEAQLGDLVRVGTARMRGTAMDTAWCAWLCCLCHTLQYAARHASSGPGVIDLV